MAWLHFEEENGSSFTGEHFEPRDEAASRSDWDIVTLKILRAHAEQCMLQYDPGQSIHTTLKDISELCTGGRFLSLKNSRRYSGPRFLDHPASYT